MRDSVLLFFISLPLVFLSNVLDPFLLSRHLFTNLFLSLVLIFQLKNQSSSLTIDFEWNTLLFLGLLICSICSIFNAVDFGNSIYFSTKITTFFLFFFNLYLLLRNGLLETKQLIKSLIFFGIVCVIITIFAFINKSINGQNLFRQVDLISGTFGNKNLLSSILYCSLPFYFIGLKYSKNYKILCVSGILLTLFFLVTLRSRSVLIALILFLSLNFIRYIHKVFFKKKFLVSILVLFLLGSSIYFSSCLGNKNISSTLFSNQYFNRISDNKTFDARVLFWNNSLKMIEDNFIFGVGGGNWGIHFPKYGLSNFSNHEIINGKVIVDNPHNDFLKIFCEIGIFGFLLFAAIFIINLYYSFTLYKKTNSSVEKNKYFIIFSFIIGYLFICFFDFPSNRIEHQLLLISIFSILSYDYTVKSNRNSKKVSKCLILIVSIIALITSTTIVLFRLNSEKHIFLLQQANLSQNWNEVIKESELAENYFYKIDTKTIPLNWYKATAYFHLKKYKESLIEYRKANNFNPNNISILNDLGTNYFVLSQLDKSKDYYLKALKISPKYEEARLNLVAIYLHEKKFDKAFSTIDLINTESSHTNYKRYLASILEQKINKFLISKKDTELNTFLKNSIKTENDLVTLYFLSKKNIYTFEEYINKIKPKK